MEEENIIQSKLLSYHNRETLNVYEDVYARDLLYRDLDLRLIPHPLTKNVNPLEEVFAVKRALYNLIMTETKERPFNMEFGTPIGGLLFNLHQLNSRELENTVTRAIELFEPRVQVRDIIVNKNLPDRNLMEISIRFSILNISPNEIFEVILHRTR